ncbi:hypothetical protein M3J07_002417 [Ascochyta lentis]
MSLTSTKSTSDLRTRLSNALGIDVDAANTTARPYLTYVINNLVGRGQSEDSAELFVYVVQHFKQVTGGQTARKSVQMLFDEVAGLRPQILAWDTAAGGNPQPEAVEDKIMCMLGIWCTMLSSFESVFVGSSTRQTKRSRKVVLAYDAFAANATPPKNAYDGSLAELILGSELLPCGIWDQCKGSQGDAATRLIGLLPHAGSNQGQAAQHQTLPTRHPLPYMPNDASYDLLDIMDAAESLSIEVTRLNAFTLNVLGSVHILWTQNASRHMLLTKLSGRPTLELFSLPCALQHMKVEDVGISVALAQEIRESYAFLFNPWPKLPLHSKLGAVLGIPKLCWCRPCSARRYQCRSIVACKGLAADEFDSFLEDLGKKRPRPEWNPEQFPHLWLRIHLLDQHLSTSRPWNFWVLFRDRRDSMPFWTFLFASIVVLLTVVQVFLGVAQVVGSFR